MLTVEQRVQRGIAYLDLFAPANWRELIDKNYINMASVYDCVAGQALGSYKLLPVNMHTADYGFMLTCDEEDDLWHERNAWYESESDLKGECPAWGAHLRDEWIKQLSV